MSFVMHYLNYVKYMALEEMTLCTQCDLPASLAASRLNDSTISLKESL